MGATGQIVFVDQAAALAAFDAQLRNVVRPASEGLYERIGSVVRCVATAPGGWSGVEWSGLDEHTADAAIAEQIAYFRGRNESMEWKYYAYDQPADLPQRLQAAGLVPGDEETVMVADVADVPLGLGQPAGVRIVAVTDPDALAPVLAVHDAVFEHDHEAMFADFAQRMRVHPETVVAVLALAGDEPVCSARVEFHIDTEFASLWGGGTLPAWRGLGIYRAVVSYRARLAAQRGYRYLRTDALPTSRPILQELGFATLTTTVPYTVEL